MKFLLDTHTFLWSFLAMERLSKAVVKCIENPDNKIFISTITFWEIAIKFSMGKIDLQGVRPEDFPKLCEKAGFAILDINSDEVSTSYQLQWRPNHKDPFDRILIWQALKSNYTIISKDADFQLYKDSGLKIFW